MRERPILYSAPMVAAILEGRKSQTRRAIKSPARNMQKQGHEVIRRNPDNDPWYKDHIWSMRVEGGSWADYTHERFLQLCPYGIVGDRLWVRESWRVSSAYDNISPNQLPTDISVEYPATCHIDKLLGRKRPSIHMPRWASRIILQITEIRAERLKDITPEDCSEEGCEHSPEAIRAHGDSRYALYQSYFEIWEKINGKGSWDLNPWVWIIEFRRI